MQDKIFIAVDPGKSRTKAIAKYKGNTYTTSFRTKLQQVQRLGIDIAPNSYLVGFNGNEYLLGDMVSDSFTDFTLSKNSTIHQLAVYTAIIVLLQKANAPLNSDIHLAVTTPINTFKDSIQKELFNQLIKNQGKMIHMTVNKKSFSIDLTNVTLAFEGMGEVYAKTELYKNENTIMIDIGGLNTTFCTFKGITPLLDTMVVSDLGINVLSGKIGNVINTKYGLSVSADDLDQVLRKGYFSSKGEILEESKAFIEEMKYDHLQQIIQFAKSRGYTFNMSDIHFTGGGSIILKRYIKQQFPHSILMDNPIYSNCLSALKIVEVKSSR